VIFIGVLLFCASEELTSCQITSKQKSFATLLECQRETAMVTKAATLQGYFARGYCAPVEAGIPL